MKTFFISLLLVCSLYNQGSWTFSGIVRGVYTLDERANIIAVEIESDNGENCVILIQRLYISIYINQLLMVVGKTMEGKEDKKYLIAVEMYNIKEG